MPDDSPTPDDTPDLFPLCYASPRLIRRHHRGPLWKAMVRVICGILVALFLAGYIGRIFLIPADAWLAILVGVALGTLILPIARERGKVLKEPIWEGAKDLRAQQYRASAGRFDSSGVTILDPHAQGKPEE